MGGTLDQRNKRRLTETGALRGHRIPEVTVLLSPVAQEAANPSQCSAQASSIFQRNAEPRPIGLSGGDRHNSSLFGDQS